MSSEIEGSGVSLNGTGALKRLGGETSVRNFLEDHVLFKGLDDKFLSSLTNEIQTRVYCDNEYIIRKGEVGRAMFFVLKGEVAVVSEDGETIINLMKEQSFFGEIGVLFSVPRTASCRARGRCVILILTKEKLHKAVEPYPKVADAIALIAEERFQSYVKQKETEVEVDFGDELKLGITKDDLQNVPLFRDCEVGFLHMLALNLKPIQFTQNELIIKKGEMASEMFFVARGIAEVFGEDDGKVYAQFQPGSFFGEVGLFLKVKRTASVRCVTSVLNVFTLSRQDLDKVLKHYPEIDDKIQAEAKVRYEHNKNRERAKISNKMETEIEVVRERLKLVPLFKDGSIGFLHELALSLKLKVYQAKEIIIRKDEIGQSMFFVVEGSADVISDDGTKVYAVMPQHSFFGEVALFFDVPRTATVRSSTNCSLFELAKDSLSQILEQHPVLKQTMIAAATENYELFRKRRKAIEKIGKQDENAAFDVEATTDRLKKVPIFSKCDDGFLRSVALYTSIHVYKIGEIIVRKGEIASEMFFIVSGQIEVISEDENTIYDKVESGGFFGEVGVIRGITRTATIRVASVTCDAIKLTATSLQNVLKDYPDTYQEIMLEADKRFKISEERGKEPKKRNQSIMGIVFKPRKSNVKENVKEDEKLEKDKDDKGTGKIGKIFKNIKKTLKSGKDERSSKVAPEKSRSESSSVYYTAKKRRPINNIIDLDEEFANIILYLDPISRIKLRMVCKKWKFTLSESKYWVFNDFREVFTLTTPKVLTTIAPLIGNQLVLVNLANCYLLFDDNLCNLMQTCPNILSLGISNCWKLTERGLSFIAQSLPNLQALDISYCGQLTGAGFADHMWSNLRRMDLTYCKQIGNEHLEKLLVRTAEIEELRLRRCVRITDFGLFLVVQHCRYLQSLDIADCEQFSDKCLKWIASSCYHLIHLNVSFCTRLTNGGLYDLSLGCQHFETLNLSHCQNLTDAAIVFFSENIKTLKKISLRRCRKITDAVITFLSRAAPLLIEIDVTGCPLITQAAKTIISSVIGHHVRVIMDKSLDSRGIRTPGVGGKPKAIEVPLEAVFMSIPAELREAGRVKKRSGSGKHKRKSSKNID
ncbi:hypothetical protein HK096_001296 [Nowakowskiella sp. JEL0078]|nr:hypothetical protein HK096_001296 [Nowakowskiella sp. JEL0078]